MKSPKLHHVNTLSYQKRNTNRFDFIVLFIEFCSFQQVFHATSGGGLGQQRQLVPPSPHL